MQQQHVIEEQRKVIEEQRKQIEEQKPWCWTEPRVALAFFKMGFVYGWPYLLIHYAWPALLIFRDTALLYIFRDTGTATSEESGVWSGVWYGVAGVAALLISFTAGRWSVKGTQKEKEEGEGEEREVRRGEGSGERMETCSPMPTSGRDGLKLWVPEKGLRIKNIDEVVMYKIIK